MNQLTLQQMRDMGVHELCLGLCKSIINTQTSDGKELTYLLPVQYIISNWSMYDSVEWKNPITGEEHVESFVNEESRVDAIMEINYKIDDYNNDVKERKSKLGSLEEQVMYEYQEKSHYDIWSLTVYMHKPVFKRDYPQYYKRNGFIDTKQFNNKEAYRRLLDQESPAMAVGKFNQMIYEYIQAVTGNKDLPEGSTFYYPKMEFDDYMMRSTETYTNLLHDDEVEEDTYSMGSPFRMINYHDNDSHVYHDVLTQEKWDKERGNSMNIPEAMDADELLFSMPEFKVEHHRMTIDLENKNLKLEIIGGDWVTPWETMKPPPKAPTNKRMARATFEDCGLAKGNKPNRFMNLLIRYALFNQMTEKMPPIDKADQWEAMVVGKFQMNTFFKYQRGLTDALKELLMIRSHHVEIFVKKTETISSRDTKGNVDTVKKTYYECAIDLQMKELPETLRETGFHKDGIDQYSSDLEIQMHMDESLKDITSDLIDKFNDIMDKDDDVT
jgi:hypothetical protein